MDSYKKRNPSANDGAKQPYFREAKDIIFGVHAVIEAIRSGQEINKILIQKGIQKEHFFQIKEETAGKNFAIQFVPAEKNKQIDSRKSPRSSCV